MVTEGKEFEIDADMDYLYVWQLGVKKSKANLWPPSLSAMILSVMEV